MARAQNFAKRRQEAKIWPDRQWQEAVLLEAQQEPERHAALDERTAWFYEAVTLTGGMTKPRVGIGQIYWGVQKDQDGRWLQGGNDYTLRVPADAPANQFRAMTQYDVETRSFINAQHDSAGLDSRKDLIKNADGSVDLHIGPEAPQG